MSEQITDQKLMSKEDRRFVEQVFRKLGKVSGAHFINDEAELISLSGELRSLLIEGALLKAWHLIGQQKPIVVRAYLIETTDPEGGSLAGHDMLIGPIPMHSGWGDDRRRLKNFKLREYVDATAVYYKGTSISRAHLIKFIANTEGGVHIDVALNQAKAKDKEAFLVLSEFAENGFGGIKINVHGVNQIYGQLRAICDELHFSREVKEFMELVAPLFAVSYPNSPLANIPSSTGNNIQWTLKKRR